MKLKKGPLEGMSNICAVTWFWFSASVIQEAIFLTSVPPPTLPISLRDRNYTSIYFPYFYPSYDLTESCDFRVLFCTHQYSSLSDILCLGVQSVCVFMDDTIFTF